MNRRDIEHDIGAGVCFAIGSCLVVAALSVLLGWSGLMLGLGLGLWLACLIRIEL